MSLTVSGPGGDDTETQTGLIQVEAGVETERFVTRITGTTGDSLVYGILCLHVDEGVVYWHLQ